MSKKAQSRASRRPVILDMSSDQCVWSQAGVAKPRRCHRGFNCIGCEYDELVQKRLAEGRALRKNGQTESWRAEMNRKHFESRKCRHMLTGAVDVKYCANNYDCARCEFDQMLDEVQPGLTPADPAVDIIAGFAVPEGHYFHRGHTWARVEYGGRVRIGVDDFALRLLGRPDELEMPGLGRAVGQGAEAFAMRRDGHEAVLSSPVEGVVVAVNPAIESHPEAANEGPYGGGWLMMIEPARLKRSLGNLLFGAELPPWIEDEAHRLAGLVSPQGEHRLAATGGRAVEDIYRSVSGLDWDELVRTFLRP